MIDRVRCSRCARGDYMQKRLTGKLFISLLVCNNCGYSRSVKVNG